jgi:hypothetical protein
MQQWLGISAVVALVAGYFFFVGWVARGMKRDTARLVEHIKHNNPCFKISFPDGNVRQYLHGEEVTDVWYDGERWHGTPIEKKR